MRWKFMYVPKVDDVVNKVGALKNLAHFPDKSVKIRIFFGYNGSEKGNEPVPLCAGFFKSYLGLVGERCEFSQKGEILVAGCRLDLETQIRDSLLDLEDHQVP